jgi:hypothetical protein
MNIAKKTFLIAGANRGIGRAANETLDFLAPVQDLSVSSDSETPRNIDSAELIQRVNSLEAEKHRLQALVCSLLHENEQLRSRNSTGARIFQNCLSMFRRITKKIWRHR